MIITPTLIGTIAGNRRRSAASDPYWENVFLLLPSNGTNGSTTLIDYSGLNHPMTLISGAAITTSKSYFGGGSSLQFNGGYVTVGNSVTDPNAGANDVTIECDFYLDGRANALGANAGCLISSGGGNFETTFWSLLVNCGSLSSGTPGGDALFLEVKNSGSNLSIAQSFAFAGSTWYRVAFVRSGTTCYFYVDGTLIGTSTGFTAAAEWSATEYLGAATTPGAAFAYELNGAVDNVRITEGIARYTGSSYTLDTAEFPTS